MDSYGLGDQQAEQQHFATYEFNSQPYGDLQLGIQTAPQHQISSGPTHAPALSFDMRRMSVSSNLTDTSYDSFQGDHSRLSPLTPADSPPAFQQSFSKSEQHSPLIGSPSDSSSQVIAARSDSLLEARKVQLPSLSTTLDQGLAFDYSRGHSSVEYRRPSASFSDLRAQRRQSPYQNGGMRSASSPMGMRMDSYHHGQRLHHETASGLYGNGMPPYADSRSYAHMPAAPSSSHDYTRASLPSLFPATHETWDTPEASSLPHHHPAAPSMPRLPLSVAPAFTHSPGTGPRRPVMQLPDLPDRLEYDDNAALVDGVSGADDALAEDRPQWLGVGTVLDEHKNLTAQEKERIIMVLDPPPPSSLPPPMKPGKLPKATTDYFKVWLDNHTDHPYPSEEEKKALCLVSYLAMGQVCNWMINARRRILVPARAAKEKALLASVPYNQSIRQPRKTVVKRQSPDSPDLQYLPDLSLQSLPNPGMAAYHGGRSLDHHRSSLGAAYNPGYHHHHQPQYEYYH